MSRLNKERQKELQPKRFDYAKDEIIKAGFEITFEDEARLEFTFRGATIQFYPYSGWHSGKTIVDGRGIYKLLNQIK